MIEGPESAKLSGREDGGQARNRTEVNGFAGRCITTLPPGLDVPETTCRIVRQRRRLYPNRHGLSWRRNEKGPGIARALSENLERETGLEPATPTLARLCSTN